MDRWLGGEPVISGDLFHANCDDRHGLWGIGAGACFADFDHDVTCVDKDERKIAALHRGEIPIYEPGLDELFANNVRAKRLDFTTDLKQPVVTRRFGCFLPAFRFPR